MTRFHSAALMLALGLTAPAVVSSQDQPVEYGVDCSFPIHSTDFRCGDILGDRKKVYDDFMNGCRKHYGRKGSRCDQTEQDRLEMSLRQPQSMLNYTSTGFKKIRAPAHVWKLLKEYWDINNQNRREETWPAGNIYTNHWEAPTFMVSVEDQSLQGGGFALKSAIWEAAKTTIEEWTGMEQKPSSMYGIRIYTTGAILSPHVDRIPLISSCIVNVAQDVDEDWPLEVIDRFGNAVNVTMQPGDMVLYESHSLIHARPFAMKGRFFANIFIHFEPTGRKLGERGDDYLDTLPDFLPPYIIPGSLEDEHYREQNPNGWNKPAPKANTQQSRDLSVHGAAGSGDLERLAEIAAKDPKALHAYDGNGWQPIHEAVRLNNLDSVKFLLEHGVDKNARTGLDGQGPSLLNIALDYLNVGAGVTNYLLSIGAENVEGVE